MQFDRRQAELFCDFGIPDSASILQGHSTDELGEVAARSNGRATAEGFELYFADGVCLSVDANLELHHITTYIMEMLF